MAVVAGAALLASACSANTSSGDGDGAVELTISTFTEFGYEQLLKEYDDAHPNITITHRKAGQAGPHHNNLFTKLGAGSGVADVVAVEEGYLADVLARSDKFRDLKEIGPDSVTPDRWLDWKYQKGTTKDGKWIGYGTDIGPLAMCYRKDMLEAAGMPSDPEAVKDLFKTWEDYYQAGSRFVANSDKAWFDAAAQNFNAMVNQLDVGYFNRDNTLALPNNEGIKQAWDQVVSAVQEGQSAGLTAFSNEWNTGFKQGAFATKVCPSWMIGVIEEQAGPEHEGKWAVTDVFPNGGGNWGGSYLTVPNQSQHQEQAAELAAWLTAPEQQLRAFQEAGTFPSQQQALESDKLLSETDEYFGGAKVGEIFAQQAQKVGEPQYKGPGDGQIQDDVMAPALQSIEQGTDPEQAWRKALEDAQEVAR